MKLDYLLLKRVADMVVSAVAIIIVSPVLLVTAGVLKATGEHLVIYRQRRVGRDYKLFNIYKFVTMLADSPKYGTITAKNDPRVLPVGRVLRKAKINEIPQLFNILFGQMSFVGPRPLVESEVAMYPPRLRSVIYADNTPGLTGVGSLFFRDEDEIIAATGKPVEQAYREDIIPIKGELEAWYRDHKSFAIDLRITLLTVWAVISPRSVPVAGTFRSATDIPAAALEAYERLVATKDR